ncbi:MAG: bifunctional folylpolyglutamate synthase/dihydrofolate synthase [Clostridia bacterium]|nr:bifunctional folylpolyglutamate synthase/dihydrofolate synthase [Clostridia bacterium]
MNYYEALTYTHSLKRLGKTPGLACLSQVMEVLGNPQEQLKVVHVAGTNGKGSVCAMTASVLEQAGYKVVLFTSPYLRDFRERFQIHGKTIEEETYAALCSRVKEVTDRLGEELSQFAFITAVAFSWFYEENCDLVVLETGLGGRLDATNLVKQPLVTAITNVSLDHTELLGNTVGDIMKEKCGIMKENGVTVVSLGQEIEALAVAMETAAVTGNRLIVPNAAALQVQEISPRGTTFTYGDETYTLSLLGAYQPANAVTALEILNVLAEKGFAVSKEAIQGGLYHARHPGRCQVLREEPLILLDGAHNPQGAQGLANTLEQFLQGEKAIGVCGVMTDKAAEELKIHLEPYFKAIVAVTPNNSRALPAEELAKLFGESCQINTARVDEELIGWLKMQTKPVVIFGSLYLAGEILKLWDQ